ncbi:hypothetical protein O3P69_012714 [Scylla paramamosain]|uniref:Uncharacterized protein n=1 Tax=Scylla paramamosain TaxID=85552 RepID=A0AAW0SHY8_SCYPA
MTRGLLWGVQECPPEGWRGGDVSHTAEQCCHGDGGGGHDTDAGAGVCARWRHAAGQILLLIAQTGVYMYTSFTIIGGHFTMSDA